MKLSFGAVLLVFVVHVVCEPFSFFMGFAIAVGAGIGIGKAIWNRDLADSMVKIAEYKARYPNRASDLDALIGSIDENLYFRQIGMLPRGLLMKCARLQHLSYKASQINGKMWRVSVL
jgi:hypothetical protein